MSKRRNKHKLTRPDFSKSNKHEIDQVNAYYKAARNEWLQNVRSLEFDKYEKILLDWREHGTFPPLREEDHELWVEIFNLARVPWLKKDYEALKSKYKI